MTKTKNTGVYQYVSEEKRHDGRPDVCFYYNYKEKDTGKKIWVKVGWRSEKITAQYASEKRGEFLTQLRNGETPTQSRKSKGITYAEGFAIFKEVWFPNLKSHGGDMELRFNTHTGPKFGKKAMSQITPLELESYKTELLQKGFAAATVRLILGDMRNVYNKLKRWGKFKGDNPFEQVQMPKVDNKRTRFLNRQEADLLLDTINQKSRKWFLIATISLNTGARLGEVIGTRVQDLHMENRVWHIQGKTGRRSITINNAAYDAFAEALESRKNIIVFTHGKVDDDTVNFVSQETGMYPTDVRYLHLECIDMEQGIITYRRRNSGKYNTFPITEAIRPVFEKWVGDCSSDLVFPARGGIPISSSSTKTFDRAASACALNKKDTPALDKVVFHTLRHTYCSWEAQKGTPLFKIARLVGHATTDMTERYAHLCPQEESRHLLNQDSTMEQLHTIMTSLVEKGIEQVPQAVLDWIAAQNDIGKAI